jgi:hypothetical protein
MVHCCDRKPPATRRLSCWLNDCRVEEPFRPGTLRDPATLAREAAAAQKSACPTCHTIHLGE